MKSFLVLFFQLCLFTVISSTVSSEEESLYLECGSSKKSVNKLISGKLKQPRMKKPKFFSEFQGKMISWDEPVDYGIGFFLLEMKESSPGTRMVCTEFLGAEENTLNDDERPSYAYPHSSPGVTSCMDWSATSRFYTGMVRNPERKGDASAKITVNREDLRIGYWYSFQRRPNQPVLKDSTWFGSCEVSSEERLNEVRESYSKFRSVFIENRRQSVEKLSIKSKSKNRI